jgi:hypothetical protein
MVRNVHERSDLGDYPGFVHGGDKAGQWIVGGVPMRAV